MVLIMVEWMTQMQGNVPTEPLRVAVYPMCVSLLTHTCSNAVLLLRVKMMRSRRVHIPAPVPPKEGL